MSNNTSKPTLDWDKPLQTADKREAVLLTKEYRAFSRALYLVMISDSVGNSHLHRYYPDSTGAYYDTPPLRNKTRKVTKWYNLYRSGPGGVFYTTREDATQRSNHALDLLEVRSIEIEEPL